MKSRPSRAAIEGTAFHPIILGADPSEDVTVLGDPSHVRAIIKDGKPVDLASWGHVLTASNIKTSAFAGPSDYDR
ncbi:MAG: hypothetical protein WB697_19780 [Stellaceae bacterium]